MKPRIGIVICGIKESSQYVSNAYIQSIRYAGGLPLLLPLVRSNQLLAEYIHLCDGFLFCGGQDITPLLFGEAPIDGIGKTSVSLDLFQIRLMKSVLDTKKPILAICRGMQVLNVACGGTLYQNLLSCEKPFYNHMQDSQSRSDVSHFIKTERNCNLQTYIGTKLKVNSFHHQAVHTLGSHLRICASSSDQLIEAIEMPQHPFAIGVQWHPESMYRSSPEMRNLFREFILHCETNRQSSYSIVPK